MFPVPLGFLWYLASKIEFHFKVYLDLSNARWKFFNFFHEYGYRCVLHTMVVTKKSKKFGTLFRPLNYVDIVPPGKCIIIRCARKDSHILERDIG